MKLRRLATREAGFEAQLAGLARGAALQDPAAQEAVRAILADVRVRGDAAVLKYTRKFDRIAARSLAELEVPKEKLQAALKALPRAQAQALREARGRIREFHQRQLQSSWDYTDEDGTRLGQRVSALDRVGIYVPGGKAAYPSSVLMNALPAKVAGVRELVMVSPAPQPLVLAAAALVDKIVGPGNVYVAEAKRQVFGLVGIDMVAGPSEILVISDGRTPADWVAMDLFSQAEHDEAAQALLLSPQSSYLDQVELSMERLLPAMPRREIITASLEARGGFIETRDLEEACALANRIAPEHLELSVEDPQAWLPRLKNAGAIFLGRWSSEAIGDYCAGPNHVLPTAGSARFSSPLGVYDIQKRSSVIDVSQAAAARLGKLAAVLAEGEGLTAHARSAQMRFK